MLFTKENLSILITEREILLELLDYLKFSTNQSKDIVTNSIPAINQTINILEIIILKLSNPNAV